MKKHITPKSAGVLPIENQDIKNKVIILDVKCLKPEFKEAKFQLWKSIDGFGTSPTSRGRAILSQALEDGEKTMWIREDFIGIASDELIAEYFPNYGKKEFILCAAIKYNDTIICGHRHGDCYTVLKNLTGKQNADEIPTRDEQGFMTSLNRYVDRKEAWKIAKENNQIQFGNNDDKDSILISENLY